ncbi:MAG: alginate lyase family protein [Sphaerochaetaceae bacterium]
MTRQEFFRQPGKVFFIDDLARTVAYVQQYCHEEAASIIAKADAVARQSFVFDLRWDMEQTTLPIQFTQEIDWLYQPADDPEFVYQFNRHRFFICLGQAYALTGDERYAQVFTTQIVHWITHVRREDPSCAHAWRTIEAGLRLEYWLKALWYFQASPWVTDAVCATIAASIEDHARYLMEVYDSFRLVSNWGILQNHGLFIASVMMPDSPTTQLWRQTSLQRLEEQLQVQVYADGVHWEQSPMYHNEVLHDLLDVKTLADRNGIALSPQFDGKLHAMCLATMHHTKPDGMELMNGDSDGIDTRDRLTRAAALFMDPHVKWVGYPLPDFDSAWELGIAACQAYIAMEARPYGDTVVALSASGNFHVRSGWSASDSHLHFSCGTLGAGHGHSDKLHIDLFHHGEDILVDAGRFTYVDKPERKAFKAASAHNTIVVDGVDFSTYQDSWTCATLSRPVNRNCIDADRYVYLEGGHLGYQNRGVYVNRRIVFLRPDIYLVCDELYAQSGQEHAYSRFFHFNPDGQLMAVPGGAFRYTSQKNVMDIHFTVSGTTVLDSRVIPSKIAQHYNQSEENQTVETDFRGKGSIFAMTVFSVNPREAYEPVEVARLPVDSNFKHITFDDTLIEAWSIHKGQRAFVVVVGHQEYASPTDSFTAGGCLGFGQVVVFDTAAGESRIGTVLLA